MAEVVTRPTIQFDDAPPGSVAKDPDRKRPSDGDAYGVSKQNFEEEYYGESAEGGLLNASSDTSFYYPQARAKLFAQWIRDVTDEGTKERAQNLLSSEMKDFTVEGRAWQFPIQIMEEVERLADDPSITASSEWYSRTVDGEYHQQKRPPQSGDRDYPDFNSNQMEDTPMGDDSFKPRVAEICGKREASQALRAVLQSPKDEAVAETFDKVVNIPLRELREDEKLNVQFDLTLNVKTLRAQFMEVTIQMFALGRVTDEETKEACRKNIDGAMEWLLEQIAQKGYPQQWASEVGEAAQKHVEARAEMDTPPFDQGDIAAVRSTRGGPSGGIFAGQPTLQPAAQPSQFADCIKITSSADRTIRNEEICGWRAWGRGFMLMVRISEEGSLPKIYRFESATEGEVDDYKQTESALKVPTLDEVASEDKKALKGCDPRHVHFQGVATKSDLNERPTHNPTLLLFRLDGDDANQAPRMLWGSQFESLVTPRKYAKEIIRQAYNLGLGDSTIASETAYGKAARDTDEAPNVRNKKLIEADAHEKDEQIATLLKRVASLEASVPKMATVSGA